jgi:hypothetical protein
MIQDAIVRFYELEFTGVNDMNIELLQNMVTSLLIKDELYIFLLCLYTLKNLNEIELIERLFVNKKSNVDLTFLEVKDDFKLNKYGSVVQA